MTRDWVVRKRDRCCRVYACERYDKPCKTVTVDKSTGIIRALCATCNKVSEVQAREWRESKACKTCGHVRKVKVWQWAGDEEPRFNEYCDACTLLRSAAVHRAQAEEMYRKAQGIIRKRQQQKGVGT